MIARELINHMIPPLKKSDTAKKAIAWMEELRVNQLPVIEDGAYKGLISEEVILEDNDNSKIVSEYKLQGLDCQVYENQHFYDVLKIVSDHGVQLVAVLDDDQSFLGVISIKDTVTAFAQSAAVQSPGGILILSLKQIDYSLAEISRLIESNDAKILSCIVNNDIFDANMIKLTLKINKTDLSAIIATLERFEYKIIAKFEESPMETSEKERLDILFKYLDI
ncbi:MAG: CBS domain-containing protein [Cyclobacteriaceae bacterium]|nr:CBS domain-containing protein [Cyclobacteriaceae bacterium]